MNEVVNQIIEGYNAKNTEKDNQKKMQILGAEHRHLSWLKLTSPAPCRGVVLTTIKIATIISQTRVWLCICFVCATLEQPTIRFKN